MSSHNFHAEMKVPVASQDLMDRADRLAPVTGDILEQNQPSDFTDLSPFASMPGMTAGSSSSQIPWSAAQPSHGRRTSSSRNDLTVTMDRMAIGQRTEPSSSHPIGGVEQERLNPEFWARCIHSFPISPEE